MTISFSYEVRTINDPSNLTEGWKPAFLLDVTTEPTPDSFYQMKEKHATMNRWHFAVWQSVDQIGHVSPEHQTAPSSPIMSPGGRNPASKKFLWMKELLGVELVPGQQYDLTPPVPCRVKIKRKEIYANVMDLERWEEGFTFLTEDFRMNLHLWWMQKQSIPAPVQPPQHREPAPHVTAWPGAVQGGPISAPAPAAVQPAADQKPGW
jgi:hypothetical protein